MIYIVATPSPKSLVQDDGVWSCTLDSKLHRPTLGPGHHLIPQVLIELIQSSTAVLETSLRTEVPPAIVLLKGDIVDQV